MSKIMNKLMKKEYLYAMIFIWILVVDQRAFTAMNYERVAFVQSAILPFLLIFVLQMKLKNEHKKKYIFCATIFSLIFIIGSVYLYNTYDYYFKYIVILLEVLISLFVLFYTVLNRKQYLIAKKAYNWISILWIVTLLLMGIAKYNGMWTWIVLAIFTPLTMLDLTKEEKDKIVVGLIYGLIASYFLLQDLALLIRPYDMMRYNGIYANPNLNALFYMVVFIACLANGVRLQNNDSKRWLQVVNVIIGCSTVAFAVLCGSKTGMLTVLGIAFLFCFVFLFRKKEKVGTVIRKIMIWVITVILLIPICYSAARYMPHMWSYTVYFYGEYSPSKIHSYEPYNSDKYPEAIEIVELMMDRYLGIEINVNSDKGNIDSDIPAREFYTYAEALEMVDGTETLEEILTGDITKNLTSYTARMFIWNEYAKRLNWTGHAAVSTHAHNIFLEFLYYFGILAGGLFFVSYVITALYQLVVTYKSRLISDFFALAYIALFGVFGLLELDWYRGQVTLSLFFFSVCLVVWNMVEKHDKLESKEINFGKEN
jgi:O-antigen ligase